MGDVQFSWSRRIRVGRDLSERTDTELSRRALDGDPEAFGELRARHEHAGARFARRLAAERRCDDLVARGLLGALELHTQAGDDDISFTTCLHLAIRTLHAS